MLENLIGNEKSINLSLPINSSTNHQKIIMQKFITSGLIILGLLIVTTTVTAQNDATQEEQQDMELMFQEGSIVVNAGIGIAPTYSWGGGNLGIPFGGGVEYGVTKLEKGVIGVGADFGIASNSNLTITYLGLKGAYHLNEIVEIENEKLDLYAGLGIYYRNFNYSGSNSYNFSTGGYAGYFAGARYYFTENAGVYAEVGNNWGWLNLGGVFSF